MHAEGSPAAGIVSLPLGLELMSVGMSTPEAVYRESGIHQEAGWQLRALFVQDASLNGQSRALSGEDAGVLYRQLRDPHNPAQSLLGEDAAYWPRQLPFAVFRAQLGRTANLDVFGLHALHDICAGLSTRESAAAHLRSIYTIEHDRTAAARALSARHVLDVATRGIVTGQRKLAPIYEQSAIAVRTLFALMLSALGESIQGMRQDPMLKGGNPAHLLTEARRALCADRGARGVATALAITQAFDLGIFVIGRPYRADDGPGAASVSSYRPGSIEAALGLDGKEAVIEAYSERVPIVAIAEKHDISPASVVYLLRKWGHYNPKKTTIEDELGTKGKAAIIADYRDDLTLADIARKYKMSPFTAGRLLRKWKHHVPRLSITKALGSHGKERLVADYNASVSQRRLAERYGISTRSVSVLLANMGYKLPRQRQPIEDYE